MTAKCKPSEAHLNKRLTGLDIIGAYAKGMAASEAQLNARLTSVLLALLESQTFQELRVTGGTSAGLNSAMRKMILRKIKSRAKHARVGFASWVLDDDDKLSFVTFNVSFRKTL